MKVNMIFAVEWTCVPKRLKEKILKEFRLDQESHPDTFALFIELIKPAGEQAILSS